MLVILYPFHALRLWWRIFCTSSFWRLELVACIIVVFIFISKCRRDSSRFLVSLFIFIVFRCRKSSSHLPVLLFVLWGCLMALSVEGKQWLGPVYVMIVFLFVPSFRLVLDWAVIYLLFYTDAVAEGISYNVFCFGDVCVSLDCCGSRWNGGRFFWKTGWICSFCVVLPKIEVVFMLCVVWNVLVL